METLYALSKEDRDALAAVVRDYRAGKLTRESVVTRTVGGQRVYGPLFEVTEVSGGTCKVKRFLGEGESLDGLEIAGVYYDTGNPPLVGDHGSLHPITGGDLFFFNRTGPPAYETQNGIERIITGGSTNEVKTVEQQQGGGSWSATSDTFGTWKFQSPLCLAQGTDCYAWISRTWLECEINSGGAWSGGGILDLRGKVELLWLFEDFNQSTVTRAELALLDNHSNYWYAGARLYATSISGTAEVWWRSQPPVMHDSYYQVGDYYSVPAGGKDLYGFALHVADLDSDQIQTGATREAAALDNISGSHVNLQTWKNAIQP